MSQTQTRAEFLAGLCDAALNDLESWIQYKIDLLKKHDAPTEGLEERLFEIELEKERRVVP